LNEEIFFSSFCRGADLFIPSFLDSSNLSSSNIPVENLASSIVMLAMTRMPTMPVMKTLTVETSDQGSNFVFFL
jgi:hypothetical protein